ncbi:sigma-70 family RNA polymerase sigma factor [Ectothiorhodospiraceae bacterium BW-2]|nr:sigma-70 family RNA polymerase sigma factor [Ectothiorhodospiraceae bacterium BW-2]
MNQPQTAHFAQQWLQEHGDALYRYALLQCRTPHQAEELVQETLLAAIESYPNYSGKASIRTWLIGILKNKAIDYFRRCQRETLLEDESSDEQALDNLIDKSFKESGHWSANLKEWGDPEKMLQQGQFWQVIQLCLGHLPQRLQQIFLMKEIFEQKSENICQELQISATNLWTMLYRARMGLRHCFDNHWR